MIETKSTEVFSTNPLLAKNHDQETKPLSKTNSTPIPPENKPLDDYFMPHNQLIIPRKLDPTEMPSNQYESKITALYWNCDNFSPKTALAVNSSISGVIGDVKPELIALADTRRHSAPNLKGYTPVKLALPSHAKSGGVICYYSDDLSPHIQFHKDVANRSLLLEMPMNKTVFLFTYLPPSSSERVRNKRCVMRWTEKLKVYAALGWRTIIMGDLNVAVPSNAPKQTRKTARQNKKMIRQMRAALNLTPVSVQTTPPTTDNTHFAFLRKNQLGPSSKSHIDWTLFNEGPAWRNKVPLHRIHYGNHPMCHLPISLQVEVNDISDDPFTITVENKLMWTGGTYDRAAFEFQDIKEDLDASLEKIERTSDTPTNKASAMWHVLQYAYFSIALHSGAAHIVPIDFYQRTHGPAAPEVRKLRSQIWKKIIDRENMCLDSGIDLIDVNEEETPVRIRQVNDDINELKTKLQRVINQRQIQALERKGRKAENIMGAQKDAKQFFKLFNLKDPTSVALQRPGEALNPSYPYQAGIVDEHVQTLFTKTESLTPEDAAELSSKQATESHRPCDDSITAEELLQVINTKNRGSPGADHLNPGFFLSVTRHSLEPLLRLYNFILDNEVIPTIMALELMNLIPKKDGVTTPDRMRAICRTGIVMGTFSTCISNRIMNEIEQHLDDGITATRRRKGCPDAILAVHTAKVWAMFDRRTLVIQTLDQRKAYDSIMADAARLGLYRMLGNGKLARIAMQIIDKRPVAVTWKYYAYRPFVTSRGVPQGSGVSCTLPNILLNPILETLREKREGVFIDDYFVGALSYVDDIVLLAKDDRMATFQQEFAEKSIARDGMKLNGDKHEALVTGPHDATIQVQQVISRLNDAYEECTVQPSTLRYLGVYFTANSHMWGAHFAKRMGRARALIAKAQANGAYQEIPAPYTTRTLYQSFIRAAFLFSAEVAPFDDKLMAKCRRLQTRALAPGLALHSGANGTLLNAILGVPPIDTFIEELKLRWWADGMLNSKCQSELRARHRILWGDMRRFLQQFDLTTNARPGPQSPIHASPTAQIVRILDNVGETENTFNKIKAVLFGKSGDAMQCIAALTKHVKGLQKIVRRYNDEKFLGAIRKSTAPISKWLLKTIRRNITTHRDFQEKYPDKEAWVEDNTNLTTDEGAFHKQDQRPRWTCVIDDIIPPSLYQDSQRTETYRAFWALCFGLPHWHYIVPKGKGGCKTCPLCQKSVPSFATHILYQCERAKSFRPPSAAATPIRQDRRGPQVYLLLQGAEILPGWTAAQLWRFADALTRIEPALWNLSGEHRIDMGTIGQKILDFEDTQGQNDHRHLIRTLWETQADIEETLLDEADVEPQMGDPRNAQPKEEEDAIDSDSSEEGLLEMLRDLRGT